MQQFITLAGRNLADGASRAAARVGLYLAFTIILAAGLSFLLVAASIAIADLYGVVIGWLFAGSVLIAVSVIGLLAITVRRRRVVVRRAPVRPVSEVDLALGLMPGLMRTSPWAVLAVCAAGAFFAARSVHGSKRPADRR
ncbi:hypothetical protein [Rhizobium sp. FKL33]|uniref:hypothetical protein n=1 Tax=Rhizobium sp. FKL33 TaxID=2562307 RepID=UPI0010C0A3AE|nr:hypothetical protein [Rhizobium sp. FKL33]